MSWRPLPPQYVPAAKGLLLYGLSIYEKNSEKWISFPESENG
jgi:hypothetical protein